MAIKETLDDAINLRVNSIHKAKFVKRCAKLKTTPSAMLNRMMIALNDNRLTIEPTKEEKELTNVN